MTNCGNQTDSISTNELTVTIQINGETITTMQVPSNICNEPLKALAAENDAIVARLGDRIEKDILLEGKKIVNILV
ncbi:MAG: hypothetical protein OEM02_02115 [Desulfobulbaceae bacterium]|nr:hypothetical protein [Desulfobulbaceae bacterium]